MACKFHKHIRSNLFELSITILIKLEKLSEKNVDECVGSKTHRGFFFLIDIYLHGKNREINKCYERLL